MNRCAINMSYTEFQEEIERQHQHVLMLGKMMTQMGPALKKEELLSPIFLSVYESFLLFLKAHFAFEEKVLEAYQSDLLASHKKDHETWLTIFAGFRPYMVRDVKAGEEDAGTRFTKYLMEHIADHDAKMFEFLANKMA